MSEVHLPRDSYFVVLFRNVFQGRWGIFCLALFLASSFVIFAQFTQHSICFELSVLSIDYILVYEQRSHNKYGGPQRETRIFLLGQSHDYSWFGGVRISQPNIQIRGWRRVAKSWDNSSHSATGCRIGWLIENVRIDSRPMLQKLIVFVILQRNPLIYSGWRETVPRNLIQRINILSLFKDLLIPLATRLDRSTGRTTRY